MEAGASPPGSLVPGSQVSVTQPNWSQWERHPESDVWTCLPTPTGLDWEAGLAHHLGKEQPGRWPQRPPGVVAPDSAWPPPSATLHTGRGRAQRGGLGQASQPLRAAAHLGQGNVHPRGSGLGTLRGSTPGRIRGQQRGSPLGTRLTSWARLASGLAPVTPAAAASPPGLISLAARPAGISCLSRGNFIYSPMPVALLLLGISSAPLI